MNTPSPTAPSEIPLTSTARVRPATAAPQAGPGGRERSLPLQDALVYGMVAVAASDRDLHDAELDHIAGLVRTLPVFAGFDLHRLPLLSQAAARLLAGDDGLARAVELVAISVPPRHRETLYALACEVAAIDRRVPLDELRAMQMLRRRLKIDRLACAAIERATAARLAAAA
ncbi:MAG: tellurite resistance TerB family protein [Dongiaceae bacterium]